MDSNLDWLQKRVKHYRSNTNDMCETIEKIKNIDKLRQRFTSTDPLKEVNLGSDDNPRPTYINKNLKADYKVKLIGLLKEYVDCFAWSYNEMLELSRELVEHRLPIKSGFSPFKQPMRRFNPNMHDRIKEEINRLLDAKFIRHCRHVE